MFFVFGFVPGYNGKTMINVHKLDNGMTVILEELEGAKTASVLVGVSIGSMHENDNQHGLAHFFEHMCFKGTKKYPTHVELLKKIEGLGSCTNAFTSYDRTAYYLSGSSEKLSEMLEITAEMFLSQTLPEEEMEKEKEVIIQEIDRAYDKSAHKLYLESDKSVFKGTPLGHPTLGDKDSVRSFSIGDFRNFLEEHYVSGNTVISVAGGFNSKEILEKIKELYADIKVGAKTEVGKFELNPDKKHISLVKESDEQMTLHIDAVVPNKNQDLLLFEIEILNQILGGGMASRLFLNIREALGACYSIGSGYSLTNNIWEWGIHTGVDPSMVSKVTNEIVKELKKLKTEGIEDEELARAKEQAIGSRALSREKAVCIAIDNFTDLIKVRKIYSFEEYRDKINAIDKESINKLASEWIKGDNMVFGAIGNVEVPSEVSEGLRGI